MFIFLLLFVGWWWRLRNFKFMKLTNKQKKFNTCYIFSHQLSKYFACYCSKPFLLQALVIVATIAAAAYCYYYFDNVHFHITHGYAHLGYAAAQHQIGQRYLNGMCEGLFSVLEKHSGTLSETVKNVACSDQRLWTLLCYCHLTDSDQNIAIIHKLMSFCSLIKGITPRICRLCFCPNK